MAASTWRPGASGLHGAAQVAHVVERVVDAEAVDAGVGGHLDKGVDDVVADVAVAGQRLAAQRGDERARRRRLTDRPEPDEGVLSEEAQRRLEGGATEDVESREAAAVERAGDGEGVAAAQAAHQQRLLTSPQRAFDQLETRHGLRL